LLVIEPINRCAVRAGNQMAVGVHRDLNAAVPELLFHVDHRLALLQQE
jgi:hypothetical protein